MTATAEKRHTAASLKSRAPVETKVGKTGARILTYICEVNASRDVSPSLREIGDVVGLSSSSTVFSHLARLESLGMVRRDRCKPRSTVPTESAFRLLGLELDEGTCWCCGQKLPQPA